VAVTSNFVWNRVWTFRHEKDDSHVALQASRFFAVSLLAAVGGLVLLEAFVRSGMPKIPGEMLAVLLVVPISFLGNKHWSFR
jgi:putative flippase GtrA